MPKVDSLRLVQPSWDVPTLPVWLQEAEKARKWIIPGLLMDGAITIVSGQKKRARKSLFAFHTAMSLASARPIGCWKVEEPMPVLICEEEGPRVSTSERLKAIATGMNLDWHTLTNIQMAFHQRIKLDKKEWREKLCTKVKETGAKLIILDAIVYMHGGDENRVADMLPVQDTMQEIRALGCTVMFLAHTNMAKGEDPKADPDAQVRGSGLSTDMIDQHFALRRYDRHDIASELIVRGRDQEESEYSVRWNFESDESGVLQRATMAIEDPKATFQSVIVRCAKTIEADKLYSQTRLKDMWKLQSSKIKIVLEHLVEARLLERVGSNYRKAGNTQPDVNVDLV